jgi:hypothetical protein
VLRVRAEYRDGVPRDVHPGLDGENHSGFELAAVRVGWWGRGDGEGGGGAGGAEDEEGLGAVDVVGFEAEVVAELEFVSALSRILISM